MADSRKDRDLPGRRGFLKGAAAGGIGTLAMGTGAIAAPQVAPPEAAKMGPPPAEGDPVDQVQVLTTDRPGSDFMVDVLKSLGFEYVAANPGSSFRSLHESLINYGGNKSPELLTCCHEESSVGMAHGYANVEGKPMLVMAHSTVGLQHAAMNIYNAWVGRVPLFLVLGNTLDATMRRPGVEWKHSAQDAAAIVRDYTKWDDNPVSLPHFAESAVRAYRISMALPREPVVLVADSELQERPVPRDANLRIPKLSFEAPPTGDAGSVAEVARLLVGAENPVIIAGGATRTQQGMERFIELVEALQVPVVDQENNLPSRHPLITTRAALRNADVILGLEVEDFWGMLNTVRDQAERTFRSATRPGAKILSISIAESPLRTNYQDFQRYQAFDVSIPADSEATLPVLIEAVKRLMTANHRTAFENRGKALAEARQKAIERERVEATYGWDSSPISLSRLAAEVWAQVKTEDWAGGRELANFQWDYDKYYRYDHFRSAQGAGGRLPAAVGAALAHRKHGRLYVNLQKDGDLMYAPGALWTAAHHRIPFLSVMHNNRAYHQEVMHIQTMSNRRERGVFDRAGIGTAITEPNIDYAKMAQSMGLYAEGPITNPSELGPAIRRAIAVVKKGEPALVDVVTQAR
jgi:thiamine pyrophosphate-dependent acetolactate synthase large subunit-like protein